MKISKDISNVPLAELNNFCILSGLELDVERREVVLFEWRLK